MSSLPPLPGPSVPYDPQAPWPCMRGNPRNTGRSPLVRGDAGFSEAAAMVFRCWPTGNGIFSTPIIGADETLYVGSADKHFYALDPVSGEQRWRFETGECIDCAGCIAEDGTIYFASCDASLYGMDPEGGERWQLTPFADRKHFSPSTIYWWEANVVLGPNGWLYAGNDDFNFYAIQPGGGIQWAHLTGMHIWTAPAFSDDGAVYFISFDLMLYALDAVTGALRWRTDIGNFAASSPAIGPDGSVHFGSFDGCVYSVEHHGGSVRWKRPTGGPIYGTPAIAEDGSLYIGSSDGCFYALSPDGQVLWTFYTGDAIRCSAAIGPDPEGHCGYLVYFGAGNGVIYALEPGGQRRWSLDTKAQGAGSDYPNINASIALGRTGLATANANGDVFFVPYHLYLQAPDTAGLCLDPGDGYPEDGALLYPMSPGGRMAEQPLPDEPGGAAPELVVEPGQVLSFRALSRVAGRTLPVRIEPGSVDVSVVPQRPFRATVQPDGGQLNIVFEGPPASPEPCVVSLSASFSDERRSGELRGALHTTPLAAPRDAPALGALAGLPFDITHMSVFDPTIVPSLDQIGIASLTIHVRVVHIDADSGRVVAWGLQRFGHDDQGDHVQISVPRHLYYAFGGSYRDGHLQLEARGCSFETTAFPVPLDLLRFTGAWDGEHGPCAGASLMYEVDVAGRLQGLNPVAAARVDTARKPWRARRSLDWKKLGGFVRSWVPSIATLGSTLPQASRGAVRSLALALRLPKKDLYGPWGLVGADGWSRGVGTFRTKAAPQAEPPRLAVELFGYDAKRHTVVADVSLVGEPSAGMAALLPAILVIDRDRVAPVPIDYTGATTIDAQPERGRWTLQLRLPRAVSPRGRRWKAVLLFDLQTLAEVDI
jgi:outer membrane protein assembly factor BamB